MQRPTGIILMSAGIGIALSGLVPGAVADPHRMRSAPASAVSASAAQRRAPLWAKRLERQRRNRYYHVGPGYSAPISSQPYIWHDGQWYAFPQTDSGYGTLGSPPAGWNMLGTPPPGYSPLGPPPPPGYSPLGPIPPPGYSPLGTPPAPPVVPPPIFPRSSGSILPQGGSSILAPRR